MSNNTWPSRAGRAWSRLTNMFWSSDTVVMMTFATIVGVGSGFGAVIFIRLIAVFDNLFFGSLGGVLAFMGVASVLFLPAIGGLLVGPIIAYIAPEAKGHGVPEVLTAIAMEGGRIRPIVVLAKAVGSAITIGSGGSAGREGPIVQIGASLGSTIGQIARLNERRIVNLVASGAGAGIAATFNAPIAGVMFAIEIILGEIGIQSLGTIVVSAVTASVISRAILGDYPAFPVPAYSLVSAWELVFYLILGLLAGIVGMSYVKLLYYLEDMFDNWRIPAFLKPAIGGLALGAIGIFMPQVFGTGFSVISDTLAGNIGFGLLLLLVVGKTVATSLTLGSGASGGVFAPSLAIGAVLGGAFGLVMHAVFPAITASSSAYAMVGMAALFGAAARAPITAIVILFEMTQDYRIVLPLMFATIVATVFAGHFEKESIYTLKLALRGIDRDSKKDRNLMGAITVESAMTPVEKLITVTPDLSLQELARMFHETGHHGFAVVDSSGQLYGIATLQDLERRLDSKGLDGTVADICTRKLVTTYPDETLDDALRHFGTLEVGRIPVVDRHDPRKLLGLLRRGNIISAYAQSLLNDERQKQHMSKLRLESATGTEMVELTLKAGDDAVGKSLKELGLPDNCVIVSIHRGRRVIVPRGDTLLLAGDRLTALATADGKDCLEEGLRQGTKPADC
jgi:CIC family chloride channel protein